MQRDWQYRQEWACVRAVVALAMCVAAGGVETAAGSNTEPATTQPATIADSTDEELIRKHQPHGPHRYAEPTLPGPELRTPDDLSRPFWQWEHLTGDWLGARSALEERGVTFAADYSADGFMNLRGGRNSADAGAYRGLFDLAVTIDTQRAKWWPGGLLVVHFQEIHGRWLNAEHVGALQEFNNADAPSRTQVAEYYYEQRFFHDHLEFKLGKMDVNSDFAGVDYGAEFVHSSAGYPPPIPMPTFPDPALGAVMKVEPIKWLYLAGGIYDADGSGERWGFDSAFHGPRHSFTIFELGLRPVWRWNEQELPGTYRVGGWYDSGQWMRFPTRAPREDDEHPVPPEYRTGNSGVYLAFDQLIYRESHSAAEPASAEAESDEAPQGLGVFFQLAWAPSACNEISQYYGGGLQYTGLLPGRDQDITGLALFHASLGGRIQSVEERYSESAVELFHRFQLTPWLGLKPDIQYIANPGGQGRDALVCGIRMEMCF